MKRPPAFLLMLLSLAGCKKDDFDIRNLNGGTIITQGHGGMGIYSAYPIDSPASILSCLHTGADGTEIDVQMTSDSVLVAYHPDDLNDGTDMEGPVIAHTWAEVSGARYIGAPFTDHRIARLDDLFASMENPAAYIFTFDIKIYPDGLDDMVFMDRMADALIRLIDGFGLADRVHLETQQTYMLAALQARRPGLRLFYYPPSFTEGLATAQQMGLFGLTMDMERITVDEIAEAHARGLWVTLWNVRSKADNRAAIGMNPDVIQSDRIAHLVDLLE